jgi:hypothetical protein
MSLSTSDGTVCRSRTGGAAWSYRLAVVDDCGGGDAWRNGSGRPDDPDHTGSGGAEGRIGDIFQCDW